MSSQRLQTSVREAFETIPSWSVLTGIEPYQCGGFAKSAD
jgi:hypothetical protein